MIEQLNATETSVVEAFLAAILAPVVQSLFPGSWLVTPKWAEGFLARLRTHNALSEEPLSTRQFEAAFNAACETVGWAVTPAAGATNRFYDTTIQRGNEAKRLSLKASAQQAMNRSSIHISKLTEAAWVQDTRRQADRRDQLVRLFREYRETTDAILMLRGFRRPDSVLYELVEIPTDLFAPVATLSIDAAQKPTIEIPEGQVPPVFKVRVDRSDAKITLTGIRLDVCTVHATWELTGRKR